MKTVVKTGPTMFAAYTDKTKGVPKNGVRMCLMSLEVLDIDNTELDIQFNLTPSLADNNKENAKLLITLLETLKSNESYIKSQL